MFHRFIAVATFTLLSTGVLAEDTSLPLDYLPDPDPLLLEHTVQLQRDIFTSALELQYARNLDQLCKANINAERCEGYEPGTVQPAPVLPGAQRPTAFQQQFNVDAQQGSPAVPVREPVRPPLVEEISGTGADLTAILVLSSGERRAVKRGDTLTGLGRVSQVDSSGVTLINGASQTRLGGGR